MSSNSSGSLQDIAMTFVKTRTEQSFTKLYKRMRPGLKNMIMKYNFDDDTLNDILSITMSKAFMYVDRYDERWNFSTWVYKICKNECLIELRRQSIMVPLEGVQSGDISGFGSQDYVTKTPEYEYFDSGENVDPEDVYETLIEEIDNLAPYYRDVIKDRVVEKVKYEDIATNRGINPSTVKTRIHIAKKILKQKLTDRMKAKHPGPINIDNVTTI